MLSNDGGAMRHVDPKKDAQKKEREYYYKDGVQGRNWYIKGNEVELARYNPYRRKNRQIAEKAYRDKTNLPFPLHVIIETSSLCNVKCGFCNREKMKRQQLNMDLPTFKKIIDECADNGVYSVSLYCLGEPMLNAEIRQMIIYAKNKGIPYVDLSTNGMISMNDLLGTGLDEIIVSLDGDQTTHELLRKGSNWTTIVSNTDRLKREREIKRLSKPLIRIQSIGLWENRHNTADNSEFIAWAFSIGDVVYIKNVEAFSHVLGDVNLPQTQIVKRLAERTPCKQLWFVITVNSNGDIATCCHDPRGFTILGNIKDMTIEEAWRKMDAIRERHGAGDYSDFKHLCTGCVDYNW